MAIDSRPTRTWRAFSALARSFRNAADGCYANDAPIAHRKNTVEVRRAWFGWLVTTPQSRNGLYVIDDTPNRG